MFSAINDEYFEWLYDLVSKNDPQSFRKLLMYLHKIEFKWVLSRDRNRAEDGKDLRSRFAVTKYSEDEYEDVIYILGGPCSVLEMMVALAVRCEETIMDDPLKGDRIGQWFWSMASNLGLCPMTDNNFDRQFVDETVSRFLDRDYEPDGRGGLFTIKDCPRDLRTVEIWYQLCWYLDSIT